MGACSGYVGGCVDGRRRPWEGGGGQGADDVLGCQILTGLTGLVHSDECQLDSSMTPSDAGYFLPPQRALHTCICIPGCPLTWCLEAKRPTHPAIAARQLRNTPPSPPASPLATDQPAADALCCLCPSSPSTLSLPACCLLLACLPTCLLACAPLVPSPPSIRHRPHLKAQPNMGPGIIIGDSSLMHPAALATAVVVYQIRSDPSRKKRVDIVAACDSSASTQPGRHQIPKYRWVCLVWCDHASSILPQRNLS